MKVYAQARPQKRCRFAANHSSPCAHPMTPQSSFFSLQYHHLPQLSSLCHYFPIPPTLFLNNIKLFNTNNSNQQLIMIKNSENTREVPTTLISSHHIESHPFQGSRFVRGAAFARARVGCQKRHTDRRRVGYDGEWWKRRCRERRRRCGGGEVESEIGSGNVKLWNVIRERAEDWRWIDA